MERRQFCVHACQVASAAAFGAMVPACSGSSTSPSDGSGSPLPTINAPVANRTITITVDAASPLASVGSSALVQTSSGSFLVAHTGQSTFSALTAICTHEGCTVSNFSGTTYICPCHGSQYSQTGAVLKSPAPSALASFPTTFTGTTLTVAI